MSSFALSASFAYLCYVSTSLESDVYRRQILTSMVDPHTLRVNICIIAIDPQHRYSNESNIHAQCPLLTMLGVTGLAQEDREFERAN